MKIIQVIPFLGFGGAEIMCENLTYELINQGHEVVLVSLYTKKTPISERMEKAGVDVRYLDKKSGVDISLYSKLGKLFLNEKPDVVHSHLSVLKYVVLPARRAKISKVIHTVHSIAQKEAGKFSRFLNKYFFKHCGVVPVALSELVKQTIVDTYKMDPGAVPFVYNGVDIKKCIPKKTYEFGNEIKIVHVGSFYEPKNHIGLVKAFRQVCSYHPECKLYLIGEGIEKPKIEEYCTNNGLKNNVCFLGAQTDVFSWLKDMDIFTLPSNYEGVPLSLVEAMGTALPIVATAVGGVPDMVDDGKSALLTDVDEKMVAEALIKLIENKELREHLGQNALIRSQIFSSEEMAKRYIDLYKLG